MRNICALFPALCSLYIFYIYAYSDSFRLDYVSRVAMVAINTSYTNLNNEKFIPAQFREKLQQTIDRLNSERKQPESKDLEKFAKRVNHVNQQCEKFRFLRSKTPYIKRLVLDQEHRLAYCLNAKCGTRYFLMYLREINGYPTGDSELQYSGQGQMGNIITNSTESKNVSYNHLDFLKFIIVRHPIRRLVSAYCNKIINHDYYKNRNVINSMLHHRHRLTRDIMSPFILKFESSVMHNYTNEENTVVLTELKQAMDKSILEAPILHGTTNITQQGSNKISTDNAVSDIPSFREFVLFALIRILKCGGKRSCVQGTDVHIQPQENRCIPCYYSYDFIVKVETMSEDFAYFRKLTKLPNLDQQMREHNEHREKLLPNDIEGSHDRSTRDTTDGDETPETVTAYSVNSSSGTCFSYEEFLAQLTELEIDLIFATYYHDFNLFNYEIRE